MDNGEAEKSQRNTYRSRIVVERAESVVGEPTPDEVLLLAIPEPGQRRKLAVPSSADLEAVPLVAPIRSSLPVPTNDQLMVALAEANDGQSLKRLHDVVSAWQKAAEQFDLAYEEVVRLAVSRLMIERKLGAELAQTVRRGGHGSKSTRLTSIRGGASAGLPENISPQMADKHRRLASIPEEVFRAYLRAAASRKKPPTSNGARAFAARESGLLPEKPKKVKGHNIRRCTLALSPSTLECVCRALGSIDVCVGTANVKCKLRLKSETFRPENLRGTVFVSECPSPAEWLPKLAKLRRSTAIEDVLVTLPAQTEAEWFRDLIEGEDEWACCFLTGVRPSLMLAYLGHHEGFKVACAELGPVVHP